MEDHISAPHTPVTPSVGRLLYHLIKWTSSSRIIELGTACGYSTVWMALAIESMNKRGIHKDGRIVTCDVWDKGQIIAKSWAEQMQLASYIEYRCMDAASLYFMCFVDNDPW